MSAFLDKRFEVLKPYTPGEQPQGRSFIKLNTNELPYAPAPEVTEAVQQEAARLQLYPDPQCLQIILPMAEAMGLAPEQVFVGNGSDEILAFCFQALCPNGAAFADLTYGFYPVYAALYGVETTVVPLQPDYSIRPEEYSAIDRTIFIANPNAPTGLALDLSQLECLLRSNPKRLVVVDEAYVDFGADSARPLLEQYTNLLIVGTFSKSRAMAGARLGYALGSKDLIADLHRIKFSFNPYSLNRMTMAAGAAALANRTYFDECRQKVMATRERTQDALTKLGFAGTASLANFLFVTHADMEAEVLYKRLREQGILVRWFNHPRCANRLRITVGTDSDMDELIRCIRVILQDACVICQT